MSDSNPDPITFKSVTDHGAPTLARVKPSADAWPGDIDELTTEMEKMIKEDTGYNVERREFNSTEEYNNWTVGQQSNDSMNLIMGLDFSRESVTVSYNSTSDEETTFILQLYRAFWRLKKKTEIEFRHVQLNEALLVVIDIISPFFILISLNGYYSVCAMITTDDVKGPKRPYLLGCGLRKWVYWLANYVIDYVLWLILCAITLIVFVALNTPAYRQHTGFIIYTMIISGLSVVPCVHCLSFICKEAETSATLVTLVSLFSVMLFFIVDIVRGDKGAEAVAWTACWIPFVNYFKSLSLAASLGDQKFSEVWKRKDGKPLLVVGLVNIVLYWAIVYIIEWSIRRLEASLTRRDYASLVSGLSAAEVTDEAMEAARLAHEPGDFAIRICDVSRVFFDENKRPVIAVRDASLGIPRGALVGFLGANGAGKTTLMRIITGEIPASAGSVETDGECAIVPQFNDHLSPEMTAYETFSLFARVYGVDGDAARERFVHELGLEEHINKTVKTLSGGNARKLAIAIGMMSPATVVLLDEPTSSLDPVARHCAQRLISSFRGEKTMMLCTHLLGEAEELCESISIMLKGSIYVVGTPAYLSDKFGTEWRLDALFSRPSDGSLCQRLQQRVPSAKIVVGRTMNEIYAIPSDEIPIAELFRFMKTIVDEGQLGVKFFTCSSATLEKVFLELVQQSEEAAARALAGPAVIAP